MARTCRLTFCALLGCMALAGSGCGASASAPANLPGDASGELDAISGADGSASDTPKDAASADAAAKDSSASDSAGADSSTSDSAGQDAAGKDTAGADVTAADVAADVLADAKSDASGSDAAADGAADTAAADAAPADIAPPVPVQCTGANPTFPDFSKACGTDSDCFVAYHQVNCCGTLVAWGLASAEKSAFDLAEAQCDKQYPGCGCAQMPTAAEDGYTSMDGSGIEAVCVAGKCTAAVTGAKPVCTELSFTSPKPLKFCKVKADCAIVQTLTDCCGSQQMIGISQSAKTSWDAAAAACPPKVLCDCLSKPTIAEDGQPVSGGKLDVACKSGSCQTTVTP